MDIRISSLKITVMKVIMDCTDLTDIDIISFYHVHSGFLSIENVSILGLVVLVAWTTNVSLILPHASARLPHVIKKTTWPA